MPEANKFIREYFLLENFNTASINSNSTTTGYIKIEIKNDKARLNSVTQNIWKSGKERQIALYMIKSKSNFDYIRVGIYEQKNDIMQISSCFDPINILGSKLDYNDISIFLVIEEDQKGKIYNNNNYLVAFRSDKKGLKAVKEEMKNVIDKIISLQKLKESANNTQDNKNIYENNNREATMKPKEKNVNNSAECVVNQNKSIQQDFDFLTVSEVAWDMDRLISCFNNFFERIEPFGVSRKDYSWWKVNSTVSLNNIFYQCNIKTPVLFNPLVMMAHYKYKHLIIGMYCDKNRKKEYLVFGIPGYYSVDERPFGEMCLWVGTNTLNQQQDDFGYWLIYIEPKSGKFVSFG